MRYDGRLPAELGAGNNRLPRGIHGVKQSGMFIDKIHDGTVIDHLAAGHPARRERRAGPGEPRLLLHDGHDRREAQPVHQDELAGTCPSGT